MKRRFLGSLCFLLVFPLMMPGKADTLKADDLPVLHLEEAVRQARMNNPVITAGKSRIHQAEAQLDQASASALPQLALSLLYQTSDKDPIQPVFIGGQQAGYSRAGFKTTWKAALTLTHLLYSGGTVHHSVESKKLALRGVMASEERTVQSVEWAVTSSWYDLLRARRKLEVAEEALALAHEHLSQVDALYRSGVVAKNEVLRVRVSVSEAELNRIQALNAVDVAWKGLERSVGVSLRGAWSLQTDENYPKAEPLPEQPLKTGLSSRPEMKALKYAMKASLSAARAARAQSSPHVYFRGEVLRADEEFFPSEMDDWKISIVAEWTFFDGGKAAAQAREAMAAAEEFRSRAEDLERQIGLEISVAQLNYESALMSIDVGRAMEAAAEEDHRMAMKRYAAGVGTNIDVLDAAVALTNARNRLAESIYDTRKARAELDWTMGISGKMLSGEAVK